ncbi:molybdopterin molybdenumtransferase MoeA [Arcobacter sp. AHV-9/2010]|uniref:molybdopterin molybdotransferase MoeA n=1 Tax=Arcobacter sp. AHV-9/2010 TaxID=2021861 RepID=UPI00100A3F48|nr:molybdopterin molybdotransferase MoeA [Arcobacter sp. CECT 9299]RXJ96035.1 molybdopterin molybdenumtransferase MoeA [Arcobacter sp. CECT 9299]
MKKSLTYLNFDEACKKSLEIVNSISKREVAYTFDSLGKVVSKDIVCKKNLPSFNNSAMDGVACRVEDSGKVLKIVDTIFAGDKRDFKDLNLGECYKIMTGAKVPSCIEVIIPIENCIQIDSFSVEVPKNLKLNSNIRFKGEELKEGDVIIEKGEKINSSSIALLASQGINAIEVYRKIKIAVISTGNELKEPWENASEDEIYNCNASSIIALLKENSFDATYCGVVPDSFEKSVDFIKSLEDFDLIITSGGISMGEADFLAEAFFKCGLDIAYHGVNLKPGRAMMLGKLNKSIVLSLPGNPLAAVINAYIFLLPIAKKLQGERDFYHDFIICKNKKAFRVKDGRVEAVLGRVTNGVFEVTKDNKYGSGMISAVYESNSIMLSLGNRSEIKENEDIKVLEFSRRFNSKKVDFLN